MYSDGRLSLRTLVLVFILLGTLGGVGLVQLAAIADYPPIFSSADLSAAPSWIREPIFLLRIKIWEIWLALLNDVILNPYLYPVVAVTLALELILPVRGDQKLFSVAFYHDLFWFVSNSTFKLTLIAALYGYLSHVYDEYLQFLTIESIALWPTPVRVVLSLLVFDLFLWIGHWLRHRVRVFWCFHLVHHSQKELNLFTEDRFHIAEGIFSLAVRFVPMRMVGMSFQDIFILTLIMEWYTRIYHANLKTNYGLLKYVLVTPQSHRIHHSVEPKHWGKNLGTYLSIWDRLFGTFYGGYDEYPETGIPDNSFPSETSANPLRIVRLYLLQFIYPFRLCFRSAAELPRGA